MGKIVWNTEVNAPCCIGEILSEDEKESILIQTDWDWPGVATTFGWSIRNCQVQNRGYYGLEKCDHSSTDGTIDCPECGYPASAFIREAGEWLEANDGITAEDPGYFLEE